MKSFIVGLIVVLTSGFAFAEGDSRMCTEGDRATWHSYIGNGQYGMRQFVCYNGHWVGVKPVACREGARVSMTVHGVFNSRGENISAMATCRGGKYRFDNPAYNYRPTQGLNRCQEGRVWTEGQDRGNPGVDYICRNGRAVRL